MQKTKFCGVIAGLALVAGLAQGARADIAYGFASETISNVSVTPTAGGVTPALTIVTSTQDSYTSNGVGGAASNPTDAPQVGIGPLPPENTFTRAVTGNPPSGGSNLTRGDVLISNINLPTNSSAVVAESYLNGVGPASETGSSNATAAFSFTPSASTALQIAYTYRNDAYVATSGVGEATASYNFDITIKDAAGNVVFLYGSTPQSANTNLTLSAPPQGGEIIRSGTDTVTTPTLTAGTSYTLTFTGKAATSAQLAAVPEPGPMALAAVAGALTLAAGALRRARR